MEDMELCTSESREVFQRVWQRVMEGRSEADCPIDIEPAGDLPCAYLSALPEQPPLSEDLPATDLTDELPDCCECTALLRRQTLEALEGWQVYRHLARRCRGSAGRSLTALAADQHAAARRLSAAYFLLSGVRYWPTEQLTAPAIPSFWGTLRQRHQGEQQAELSYDMAVTETSEPMLIELYRELAASCRERCRQVRKLLEQSCL